MGSPDRPGDRELWRLAGDGDSAAFGELFDRHATAVYNHLFRRTASWSEAEDLTSAVFLQAWRRRTRVVIDRESALPWLLGGDAVAAAVDTERRMAELRRAVAELPRHEREVVELCAWSGLDQKGAAVALGVPVGTVKSRMHRARRRLAARLGDDRDRIRPQEAR